MPIEVNDSMSEDDIIRELEAAARAAEEETSEQYYTRRELEDMTGWNNRKVWRALRQLKSDGRLDVRNKRRERLDGHLYSAPAYRIMPAGSE